MKTIMQLMVCAFILTSCSGTPGKKTEQKDSVAELNKKATRDFYAQVINGHNPELVDSFVSPDYVEHYEDRHYVENRKGLKHALKDFFEAFPDIEIKINFMAAENDLVTVQFSMTGTNKGSMFGHKPTNNKIKADGVDVIRFKDGKGAEHWGYIEETKFLHQLRIKPDEINNTAGT